ncbi:Mpp10 protein [Thozetella sp. PMI_491]|nr:Mpp10 protein [Thozetella sp. PMI_491]
MNTGRAAEHAARMAGTSSTSSSLTSTSHTLTHAPGMAPVSSNHIGSALDAFLDSIKPTNSHVFLQPSPSIPVGSLQLVKETLDAFAAQVSDEQQLRQRDTGRKRKRSTPQDSAEVLKIRKLHVDGFETGQIWQQAKRIISSALLQSQDALQSLEDRNEIELEDDGIQQSVSRPSNERQDPEEEDIDGNTSASDSEEAGMVTDEDDESDDGSVLSGADLEVEGSEGIDDVPVGDDEEEGTEEEDEEDDDSDSFDSDEPVEELVKDPNGLNDGFFSIDQFNKHSQWFEDQDARGDPNTDQVSDEENIDWHVDPMAPSLGLGAPRDHDEGHDGSDSDLKGADDEDELEGDDEDGPKFGDMDLDALEGESDDEEGLMDGAEELDDMNDVYYYKDFFAPPAGSRKPRNKKASLPELAQPTGDGLRRAMNDVRRDLFEDLSEHSDSEDGLSEVSAGDPRSRRSAHERRQAKLSEEIRKLESELVAQRAWTMSGEAAAPDRPLNSLLEEDIEFEHAGKPLPVITEEISESIEALIKRRILAQEFDEVLRRRPDALGDPSSARRGLTEVDSTKSRLGLGDELAEEHVKNTNPDSYLSKNDEKLQREEQEIQNLWKDICGKLDTLSSWHYKPRPAEPTLTVVADVATISMEDVQPATAQGVSGGESMIAPQEVYKAGKETAERGEVVSKGGLPVARQEMTREEKLRRRRREKERIRKTGGADGKKGLGKKAQAQKETVGELKKGGVMVINRQGEITNVDGKKSVQKPAASSGSYKL